MEISQPVADTSLDYHENLPQSVNRKSGPQAFLIMSRWQEWRNPRMGGGILQSGIPGSPSGDIL